MQGAIGTLRRNPVSLTNLLGRRKPRTWHLPGVPDPHINLLREPSKACAINQDFRCLWGRPRRNTVGQLVIEGRREAGGRLEAMAEAGG